jgi:N-acetyl-1-D-myo-inositol-2-amino-2-deoxy-alpha-D-glucopyranoside deacetylase
MVGASSLPGRRLLAVHAHPDDESITTGGLLLRCAEAGVETTLVTCTDGRYGPVNPELGIQLSPDELAVVRAGELKDATRLLRVSSVHWLGYHDSNMTGMKQNHAPNAFWSRPQDELAAGLVEIIRSARPHIVVTYDPFGNTGHPDHVQAHRATLLAVSAAAEPWCFSAAGPAWTVRQVFYPVYPFSSLQQFIDDDIRADRPHPFEGRPVAEINYGRPDETVTHRVSIGEVHSRKTEALHAHRTQVGPHYPQLYRAALARRQHEHYRLAWQTAPIKNFGDVFESVAP